ncbi:HGxxPAAW family protein [Streptomyces sp. JNUCC 64]
MSGQHDGGHTVAGWAGFTGTTVGSLVIGTGVVGWRPGIWLGLAVLAATAALTWALHLAGWGKPPGPRPTGRRRLTARDPAAREGHPNCLGCRLAGRSGAGTDSMGR